MDAKKLKVESIPSWMSDVMQGICYWIGHRKSYYRQHPLSEGALTAELCNLIASGIDGTLSCETPYKSLVKNLKSRERLDILIDESVTGGQVIAIEVKRGSASKVDINKDVIRLAALKKANQQYRTFLMLVSEDKLPQQLPWIAEDQAGHTTIKANTKTIILHDESAEPYICLKVRRVCKAMGSTKPKQVHSAILVEVFNCK